MKLRAVIIDDEPVFVRSLRGMIERTNCDIEVAGTAFDGESGLNLIRSSSPDLVFADISMPVLDGLQLIELLRKEGNVVPFVILSGYKEFTYAKRAISLNVLDYLVKPVNPIDFDAFLQKIAQKIKESRHEAIRDLLNDTQRETTSVRRTVLDGARALRFDYWKVCVGVFSYYRKLGVDAQADLERKDLADRLGRICQGDDIWLLETRYPNEFTIVLSNALPKSGLIDAIFSECCASLPGRTITMAPGGTNLGIETLREGVRRANFLIQSGAVFGRSSMITAESAENTIPGEEELVVLSKRIQSGEESPARMLLNRVFNRCKQSDCTQAQLASLLKRVLQKSGKEELQTDADYHISLLLERSHNYDELTEQLCSLLFAPAERTEFHLNDKSSSAIIDSIAAHLSGHASERISLQSIAEEFGFNYTYLSYLFKKCLGRSPSEYLTQIRMENAKSLLALPQEMSVKEIAAAVGYDDPYYFSRVFKVATGLTPTEFRKNDNRNL